MSHKHVCTPPDGLVLKSPRGAVPLNPHIHLAPLLPLSLAVIPGGGAGHEPAHAGYAGDGMLAAFVSGDIFASPALYRSSPASTSSPSPPSSPATSSSRASPCLHPALRVSSILVVDVSLLARPSMVGLGGNILACGLLGTNALRALRRLLSPLTSPPPPNAGVHSQKSTPRSAEFRKEIASILRLGLAFYPNGQMRDVYRTQLNTSALRSHQEPASPAVNSKAATRTSKAEATSVGQSPVE
ncbi:hypothetical protein BV22DRAFT_1133872 [Leucogyrophana mollusca]|uniref:Uncharacterized protein n=1 Tax=Leucogyrophana mollusca TaxID=85980 RepID=A0ACB8B128_9AGAM|nr:hypothetical protein BV22DRAFT_1133872 [Leucogyrophana mollusca]